MDLPLTSRTSSQDQFACPYCDAELSDGVLSCRACGRDLTPVLPLLRRLNALEGRLERLAQDVETGRAAVLAPASVEAATAGIAVAEPDAAPAVIPLGRRRYWALPLGFLVLLGAYWAVVLWLDLPLAALRLASIAIPFAVGMVYFGVRPRLRWLDTGIAVLFAVMSVAAMNALLGWVDSIPMTPQGIAAWRETVFYMLSIGASMVSGMLLRVTQAALSARGLTSLPRLREALLATNGKLPMDTLKAIELTILLASTAITAITGLVAGFLGVTR